MKRVVQILFILILVLFIGGLLAGVGGMVALFDPPERKIGKDSILALDLNGVITDGETFLELLRKYRKEKHVKAVLIRINSPGGVVGPSQEIHDEIKRTREEFKKPVYVFCSALAASGAYYAAVAADKIYTTPGCMMGSIGVLMEFVNLERLYDWAKVQRYALTTGKFKNAGAEYKPLTEEQKALFQEMIDDVLQQFKDAIIAGRKMKPEFLDQYADGRIFTGAKAVKLGFADAVGSWDDARKELGELVGMGADAKVFKAKKKRTLMDYLEDDGPESKMVEFGEKLIGAKLSGRPLYLLPGSVQF
ncbi:MAG TPA: signal peptide peptidase SppA [Bdellovibrionales bacterium]|nr:signal peptide peptidase SppA [Bdellovibrionales bacterium]